MSPRGATLSDPRTSLPERGALTSLTGDTGVFSSLSDSVRSIVVMDSDNASTASSENETKTRNMLVKHGAPNHILGPKMAQFI